MIRFVHEKNSYGRVTRSMRDFDEFVRVGNMRDCPLSNAKYTWSNGQKNMVLYRLDRFLVIGIGRTSTRYFFRKLFQKLLRITNLCCFILH